MISIIIPVYNAQKYIARCVESVVSQTYKDWELILINDGSKDDSGAICDRLAKDNPQIKVIHSPNQGASSARNKGLDNASGEWVTFVDADDWLEPNHLETLHAQCAPDVDMCINSFIADMYYGARPYHFPEVRTRDNKDSLKAFFSELLLHSQFLWIKLFRLGIINKHNIRFDTSVSLGEDNIFILEYLNYTKGLSASSVCTYHYDQIDENPNSLGRRKRPIAETLHQLKSNCRAILRLYDTYQMDMLYQYASEYYYSRVFLRLVVPYLHKSHGLARVKDNPMIYFEDMPKLDMKYVAEQDMRRFWMAVDAGQRKQADYILNIYLFKKWLKSTIIKIVVDVKHAFKGAPRTA